MNVLVSSILSILVVFEDRHRACSPSGESATNCDSFSASHPALMASCVEGACYCSTPAPRLIICEVMRLRWRML